MKSFIFLLALLFVCTKGQSTYPIAQEAESLLRRGVKVKKARSHVRQMLKTIETPPEQVEFLTQSTPLWCGFQSKRDLKALFNIFLAQHNKGNLFDFRSHIDNVQKALSYVDESGDKPFNGEEMLKVLTTLNIISLKGFLAPVVKMITRLSKIDPFIRNKGAFSMSVHGYFLEPLALKETWTDELTTHFFSYLKNYCRAVSYQSPQAVINAMTISTFFYAMKSFLEQDNQEILSDKDPNNLPDERTVDVVLRTSGQYSLMTQSLEGTGCKIN